MQWRWTWPALALMAAAPAWSAQDVLKIGEINSYKAMPAFLEPYKKGMELAVEQINAQGGLLGKPVVLVTRDDNGNPGDAVRAAEELYTREKIDVLTGSFLSHVGMALTDYAYQLCLHMRGGDGVCRACGSSAAQIQPQLGMGNHGQQDGTEQPCHNTQGQRLCMETAERKETASWHGKAWRQKPYCGSPRTRCAAFSACAAGSASVLSC